jgi:hypothetical protein
VIVVERDFTPKGTMKPMSAADKKRLKGYLPFYSVDSWDEANVLIEAALERGEFLRQADGTIIEATLVYDQTLDNLHLAGDRLSALHEELKEKES